MPRAKQLTLSHENLPGMLASLAKLLGNRHVTQNRSVSDIP
jgi:hypothetical protein